MKISKYIIVLLVIAVIASACKQQQAAPASNNNPGFAQFSSEKYGFLFNYPSTWQSMERDLPDKWAASDPNGNVMIFIVSQPKTTDIAALGQEQVLIDLFGGQEKALPDKDKLNEILGIVKIGQFNNITWFTYALKAANKNSFVSGTLCKDKEVLLVMVSDQSLYDKSAEEYSNILGSFKC